MDQSFAKHEGIDISHDNQAAIYIYDINLHISFMVNIDKYMIFFYFNGNIFICKTLKKYHFFLKDNL